MTNINEGGALSAFDVNFDQDGNPIIGRDEGYENESERWESRHHKDHKAKANKRKSHLTPDLSILTDLE